MQVQEHFFSMVRRLVALANNSQLTDEIIDLEWIELELKIDKLVESRIDDVKSQYEKLIFLNPRKSKQ